MVSIYISFTYTLTWRLWFIYFNIIYNISISHLSWQQLIHHEAGERNWYIQEKTMSKWGNPQWVQKFMVLLIFSTAIIYGIFHFVSLAVYGLVIRLIIICVPWIGVLWIYNRIPTFHDDIGIAQEIKYVMIGYFCMSVFFIGLIIVFSADDTDLLRVIMYHLTYHLLALSAFITSMMMTWWPLKKFVALSQIMRGPYHGVGNDSPRKISGDKSSFSSINVSIRKIHLKLEDICMTMFGMFLFCFFVFLFFAYKHIIFTLLHDMMKISF